jgi:hypothetical protein
MTWRTNLVFREDTAMVDWSRELSVLKAVILCPGADEIPASGSARIEADRRTGELTIEVSNNAQALLETWKGKPSSVMPRCSVKGVLRFKTRQPNYVDREFATLVRYPVVPNNAPAKMAGAEDTSGQASISTQSK